MFKTPIISFKKSLEETVTALHRDNHQNLFTRLKLTIRSFIQNVWNVSKNFLNGIFTDKTNTESDVTDKGVDVTSVISNDSETEDSR